MRLASSDGAATLPSDYTFVAGDNGQHTFNNITFNTSGAQTIFATDMSNTLITGSAPVTVDLVASSLLVCAEFGDRQHSDQRHRDRGKSSGARVRGYLARSSSR